ncbi:MAG: hypothetical protein H0X66_00585 [Verrucomicrobia bacterium]|nr:hypothetical protein [Verrucomicrobiota bacterium]
MRHVRSFLIIALLGFFAANLQAAEPRIIKVLPHYLDARGRHTLSPSLYERDAYQKLLRENPAQRSALRFDVQLKAPKKRDQFKLQVELRGVKGQELTTESAEAPVAKGGWLTTWSSVKFSGEDYKQFGEITAWRVTMWDGDKQVSEQKSFLW